VYIFDQNIFITLVNWQFPANCMILGHKDFKICLSIFVGNKVVDSSEKVESSW